MIVWKRLIRLQMSENFSDEVAQRTDNRILRGKIQALIRRRNIAIEGNCDYVEKLECDP